VARTPGFKPIVGALLASVGAAGAAVPTVGDDSATTSINVPVDVRFLDNDSGDWIDGSFTQPVGGTVSVVHAGELLFRYTPQLDFLGDDSFSYTLQDASGVSLTATVTVFVTSSGVPAGELGDDVGGTDVNTPTEIPVLLNDVGAWFGGFLTQPPNGSVRAVGPALEYTPDTDFVGIDSFSYTRFDALGLPDTATVTVSVNPVAPELPTQPLFTCAASDVLCNDAVGAGLAGTLSFGRGAAFVDLDGDGDDDLFAADTDARLDPSGTYGISRFYENQGDGTFVEIDPGVDPADLRATWVGSFADYDNDGDPDVLFANGGYSAQSGLAFYRNDMSEGNGFVAMTDDVGVGIANAQAQRWWGVSWADYDNDGLLDVAITRTDGRPLVMRNDGNGRLVEETVAAGIDFDFQPGDDVKNPVWIDFDRDGDPDLYVAGLKKHAFYENVGPSAFVDITDRIFAQPFPPNVNFGADQPVVFAAAAEDFDQDGWDDLYLGRWNEQDLVLFNDGAGSFTPLGPSIGLDALDTTPLDTSRAFENTMGLGVGDLFDDGYPDVYVGSGNPLRADVDLLYCNEPPGVFARCTGLLASTAVSAHRTRGHGTVFSDIDQDGDTDMFVNLGGHPEFDVAHGKVTREENALWRSQPSPAPATATVTLEGTESNRDAIGARLRIETDTGDVFYRVVRSTQGFQSQNSQAITVPLGSGTTATVDVTWPSGGATRVVVAVGDRVHVVE
jgi:hypothetical protein